MHLIFRCTHTRKRAHVHNNLRKSVIHFLRFLMQSAYFLIACTGLTPLLLEPLLFIFWFELFEGFVELGYDDGHGKREIDHGYEDKDAGDQLSAPSLWVHIPIPHLQYETNVKEIKYC